MANTKGFTLLEILIAMSIFTLIGVASTAMLTTVIDSNELAGERFDKLQTLQRAMIIIERDVQQAIARPIRVNGELNGTVMRGGSIDDSDMDGITFVRSGWLNPQFMLPRSTLEAVAYRVVDGNLERVSGHYLDNVIGYEPKVRVLLEEITDFRVEFFTGDTRNREIEWRDTFSGTVLPKGLAVEIETEDFGVIRREFQLASAGLGG